MVHSRRRIILTLSLLCIIFSSVFLIRHYVQVNQAEQEVKGLIDLVEHIELRSQNIYAESISTEELIILPQYKVLHEQNEDLIGWIEIEGTPINYPVMFTPNDGEYYLHRNFNREYEYSGLPFVDERCNVLENRSTNVLIYGHNMKSTTMFSTLLKYRNESYYNEHPVIQFDTLYEEAEYQIVAVILSEVYKQSDTVFKFYQFVDAKTPSDLEEFITNIRELALYDTAIDVEYGDQLITLTTCAYHTENGRLAVIAKKMES